MRLIVTSALGVVLGIVAPAAFAQSVGGPPDDSPDTGQTLSTPFVQPNPGNGNPRALFSIGKLPVGVWAPVEPPYDARANRDNAANPLWFDDSTP